jgi:hypothetical protein
MEGPQISHNAMWVCLCCLPVYVQGPYALYAMMV